jgi:hypothetical protein
MASDVFWTGLFTFSGGLVGAAASYAATRRQAGLQKEQLSLERERHGIETSEAGQRRQVELLQDLRILYIRFLKAVDDIAHLPNSDLSPAVEIGKRWDAFMQADNELELAAPKGVRTSTEPLCVILNKVVYRFTEVFESDSEVWPNDAGSYMREIEADFREARERTVSLMRDNLRELQAPES